MRLVLLPEYTTFRRSSVSVFWCLASLSLAKQRRVATNVSTLARLLGTHERSARKAVESAYEEGLIDRVEIDGVTEDFLFMLSKSGAESLLEVCDAIHNRQPWLLKL
jgi:hypothetical protein